MPYEQAIVRICGDVRDDIVKALAELIDMDSTDHHARYEVWVIVTALHVTSAELCAAGLNYATALQFARNHFEIGDARRWAHDELY